MSVLEELGVRPFINAYRPLTRLGGSVLPEPVIEAMAEAARASVDLRRMQQSVGRAIARLTLNEAAYVSCGAVSGITLAVAASIAGVDPVLSKRLPNTIGMRHQVLMHACERGFKCDVAVQNAGGCIMDIGTPDGASLDDFEAAITEHTAAILAVPSGRDGAVAISSLARLGEKFNIPLIVDAAFLTPPRDTFWKYTRAGAACVVISGGKGLRGPQTTGLILGRRDFIDMCAYQGAPNDQIGRGMKVGKEELAGVYAAVKLFLATEEQDAERRSSQLKYLECSLSEAGIGVRYAASPQGLLVSFPLSLGASDTIRERLLAAQPSVYCEACSDELLITAECLAEGDEKILATQLIRTLSTKPASQSS